jgi:hypothetical protein
VLDATGAVRKPKCRKKKTYIERVIEAEHDGLLDIEDRRVVECI